MSGLLPAYAQFLSLIAVIGIIGPAALVIGALVLAAQ
jgi:hypothetical protein